MNIPQFFFLIPPRSAGIKRFKKKKYHKLGFEDEKEKKALVCYFRLRISN